MSSSPPKVLPGFLRQRERGVALLLVLAFIVLLTGIVTVFLAGANANRRLAHASFNDTTADQLARSALAIVVGDFKQEIADGSVSTTVNGITLYTPTIPANILPQRGGVPDPPDAIPNLIRRSVRSDTLSRPGIPSRASALNSAPATPSEPTRRGEIAPSRWNKHYLIPRVSGAPPTDTTPVSVFSAPDWVFVSAEEGPLVISVPARSVIGRYAYVVYDEGGLLDVNAAGCPPISGNIGAQFGLKGLLSFADLTVAGLSSSAVSDLVGWRNYASAQPSGTFGNFLFDPASATRFLNAVISSSNGFLTTSGLVWNERTDQMFTSRQTLIAYRTSTGFSSSALQHLGTFSRDVNLPTCDPAATRRVTADFVRADGSLAKRGEPLLRRFLLSKLSWIGQNGPDPVSRAADIHRDFGLVWHGDHWDYYGSSSSSLASAIPPIDGTREPDFFQLLDFGREAAGLHPTIGEILSLGASIIDQYDGGNPDNPTRIVYAGPPAPSPAPPNPVVYGQELAAPSPPPGLVPVILNRAFRSPGELGYAYKDSSTTLDFSTSEPLDAVLLDLFTVSPAFLYAGVVDLNTRNPVVLAALISGTIKKEGSTTTVTATNATNAASDIVAATKPIGGRPALGRHELGRLTSIVRTSATGTDEESRELISRALAEATQTRTWNLLIDLIAQSGRFPPTATTLSQFVPEGERRYWLHIAIDRFTGELIDQQLEAVYE